MTPQQELELSISIKRKRAAAAAAAAPAGDDGSAAPKFGMLEAAGMGVADGLTFNTSDEIAQFVAEGNERPVTADMSLRNVNRMPQLQAKIERDPAKFAQKAAAAKAKGEAVRDMVRGWQEKARTDRPLTYLGGNLGGALLLGGGLGGAAKAGGQAVGAAANAARVVPGVNAAARLGGRVVAPIGALATKAGGLVKGIPIAGPLLTAGAKGMAPGAAYAGLAAAGEAKDDRMTAAIDAMGPGAMLGGAFGAGAKAVGAPAGALWQVLTRNADQKSLNTLARLLAKGGLTPVDAAKRVQKLARGNQPVFETAAEVMGPHAEGMQTALSVVTGPGQKIMKDAFTGSIRNMRQHLNKGLKRVTGVDATRYHQVQRDMEAARLLRDKANYDAVQGHPLGGNRMRVADFNRILFTADRNAPHLQPVGKRPMFLGYVRDTLKAAEANGDFMANELKRFLQMVGDGKMPRRALSNRAINEIDKRMTQDIDVALAKGRNNDARLIKEVQDKLRVTDLHTGLGSARDTSAIGLTAKDAIVQGRKAFQSNIDLEEVAAKLHDYPQEVADAYLTGMVREMADSLANQSNLGGLADAAQKIAASPAMRDKLISALPKTAAGRLTAKSEQFMTLIDRVSAHTNRARLNFGNSATAPRQAAIEEAAAETGSLSGDLVDFVGELITRSSDKVMQRFGRGIRERVTRPGINNPKINAALSKRLAASGKKDILAVLREIDAHNKRPIGPLTSDNVSKVAARVGGMRAGTDSATNDPWAQDAALAKADTVVEGIERPLIEEYFKASTTPQRKREIEDLMGEDAAALRAMH